MKKALVLGCGLIGKLVAIDLADTYSVTVMDPSEKSLNTLSNRDDIKKINKPANDAYALYNAAKEVDVVCALLPQSIEGPVHRQVLEMGINFVSPSGYRTDDGGFDELAKKNGVVAAFDMGVAPGMSNYLVARGASMLDNLDFGCIYVGGVPEKLDPPFNYRTVFCLEDTMNEYCRPARYINDNQIKQVPALSGVETIEFPGVGKLEAFFTDGLRTALHNINGKIVAEKTLRWPGYVEAINVMKAAGCFDKESIIVGGKEIIPFNVTAELLRSRWTLCPENGDRDMTVMKVIAKGSKDDKYVTHTWNLLDKFDEKMMIHSMARTTGYTTAITARAIVEKVFSTPGFHAPEELAGCAVFYDYLMKEFSKRGINYKHSMCIEEK